MENQKSASTSATIAWILLVLSLLLNIYQWRNKAASVLAFEAKTDSLITSRVDVEKELSATYEELNKYKGVNARLDSVLAEANLKMDEQRERINLLIRKEKNLGSLNTKLGVELEELKKLRDSYLEKIDQLLVENETLKKQNTELASTVETISKNLETTVTTASILKSEYLDVKTYKKKNNDKYSETALAKRTNKIEVCFRVLENRVAKPGEKNIYLRIVEPGGKTMGALAEGSNSFKMAGSQEDVMYSRTTKVDYKNEQQDVCMNWEEKERIFAPGTYVIEVYIDDNLSSAASYVLK